MNFENLQKNKNIKRLVFLILFGILIFTRFVGLDWGLPYPMHPDERNITSAVLQLECTDITSSECLNPHFFAYGQLPIYTAYFMSIIFGFLVNLLKTTPFELVTLSLRFISALCGVFTALYILKIINIFKKLNFIENIAASLMVIFVPALIQFSHFGTTESFLMMIVSILIYQSLLLIEGKWRLAKYVKWAGFILGVAIGTKVSAATFSIIPLIAVFMDFIKNRSFQKFQRSFFSLVILGATSALFFIISSPYNIIDWQGFIHSMNYESSVGLGTYKAFYTRSFEYTIPVIFQFIKIFPFALGSVNFALFLLGFIFLKWDRKYILMRVSFLVIFLSNAFMYAKWTRFISPVFPIAVVFAIIFFFHAKDIVLKLTKNTQIKGVFYLVFIVIFIWEILPGLAYLSIYKSPDVRFVASDWIYKNIKPDTKILSETANVVDIPMPNPFTSGELVYGSNLHPISFNFYDLDQEIFLQEDFDKYISEVDYIFVPSRRVFANHTCVVPVSNYKLQAEDNNFEKFMDIGFTSMPNTVMLKTAKEDDVCRLLNEKYPILNSYYRNLLLGESTKDVSEYGEFFQVAEFTSYPRIELFGKTIFEIKDEVAEETWSVFDHPVVRIYKRTGIN